jgi:RNA polymerase sigma-70 factor (ECF subfamily)
MESASDAELVSRSLTDPEAFGGIFDRHAPVVLRYLVRRIGRTTGEALLADVFHAAFEARGRFDLERASALPWLYGIASNWILKHHRTEGRRLRATARLAAENGAAGSPRSAAARTEARLVLERVAEGIETLPEAERDVLILYAWEDQSYQEIAEALAIPVGTVRSRLHRARGRLRELIGPSGKEQDMERVEPERPREARHDG